MIEKIYKLKQQQINQQIMSKQKVLNQIEELEEEIYKTNDSIRTASVELFGSISDFQVLEIHKSNMRNYMVQLGQKKLELLKRVEYYDNIIVELNKESEQFNYILQEQKKAKLKEIAKNEDLVAAEYTQAKFIQNRKERNA